MQDASGGKGCILRVCQRVLSMLDRTFHLEPFFVHLLTENVSVQQGAGLSWGPKLELHDVNITPGCAGAQVRDTPSSTAAMTWRMLLPGDILL